MNPAHRLDLTSSGDDLAEAYERAKRAYGEYLYPLIEVTTGPSVFAVQELWYPDIAELWFERRCELRRAENEAYCHLWLHVQYCGEVGTRNGAWMLDRDGGLIHRRIHPVVMTRDGRACN